MKRTVIFALCVFGILLCSCERSVMRYSYILGYYEFEELAAKTNSVEIEGEDYLQIGVYIPKARMVTDIFGNRKSENGTYASLCKEHNDTSYPKAGLLHPIHNCGDPLERCYPNSDFTSLDVTAGGENSRKSLNEITHYVGLSVNPYIQNSYQTCLYDELDLSEFFRSAHSGIPHNWQFYPIDSMVSELTMDNLKLLGIGEMAEPGGYRYEIPDILYYVPDVGVNYEPIWLYNLFSLFIPSDKLSDSDKTVNISLSDNKGKEYITSVQIK